MEHQETMRLRLDFKGRGKHLRLTCFSLRTKGGGGNENEPLTTLSLRAENPDSSCDVTLFDWVSGVRALCVLLLGAYCKGGPEYHGQIEGEARTMASSLYEIVGDRQTKDGNRTWLQEMFVLDRSKRPDGYKRVSKSIFTAISYGDPRKFRVELGDGWRSAKLEVWHNNKRVDKELARTLASEIKRQHDDRQRIREAPPSSRIELVVMGSKRNELVELEACKLPLAPDHRLRMEIEFSRLCYPYVIWLDSKGVVQSLYPWDNFEFHKSGKALPVNELVLPAPDQANQVQVFPLNTNGCVVMLLVLLMEAGIGDNEVEQLKSGLKPLSTALAAVRLPNPHQVYAWQLPADGRLRQRRSRLGTPEAVKDPFLACKARVSDLLASLAITAHAVAFQIADPTGR